MHPLLYTEVGKDRHHDPQPSGIDALAEPCGQRYACRVRRTGNAGARQRDDHADGEDHESGQARLARGIGGSGERSGEQQSTLEGGTGATGTAAGSQQSDRGNCPAFIGIGLVCVDAAATLSRLQSRADCLQIFDVVVADG